MRVRITQRIGKEPIIMTWTKGVERVWIENDKFEIDYEKDGEKEIQHLELPIEGIKDIVVDLL